MRIPPRDTDYDYVQNVITKDFDAYEQTLAFDNKKLYI